MLGKRIILIACISENLMLKSRRGEAGEIFLHDAASRFEETPD
jgi:hypothetical protein